MKKTIIASVVVLLIAGGGIGYYLLTKSDKVDSSTSPTSQIENKDIQPITEEATEQESLTVDSAIAKMKDAGLTVGEKEGAFYQVIGASNGDKVDVDGTTVELYEFEAEDDATTAKEQLSGDDKTTLSIGSFVILIHSTDSSVVSAVETAIKS